MKLAIPLLLISPISIYSFVNEYSSIRIRPSRTICHSTEYEYEYIPPNPFAAPDEEASTLASAYPPGTPSLLRGEAVRSALKSGCCIGWSFDSTENGSPFSIGGMLKVQGKGMKDFLNNKLTQSFPSVTTITTTEGGNANGIYKEACLLDAKGRVVDRIRVAIVNSETAFLLTSPGHTSQQLLDRLDPFIFPMDQVKLTNIDDSFIFTLASTQLKHSEKVILEQAFPENKTFKFPAGSQQCCIWKLRDETSVLVIPSTGLPPVGCVGYTLVFYGSESAKVVGTQKWRFLIGESNPKGPIEIGELEYESLRIEVGQPAYGMEIGKDTKTSPLELFWEDTIDMEKGCYLGQEGVASVAKNPRGPPRIMYSVVFRDEFNIYETQSRGDKSKIENLTNPPKPGMTLYAMGSGEELSVGTITSVAESGGTGERETVALALVRRADSVLKQLKKYDLEIPGQIDGVIDVTESSGMIQPPPLDPLDGLEVIIGGSFTAGALKMIPSRALGKGRNMFDEEIVVEMPPLSISTAAEFIRSGMEHSEALKEEIEAAKAAAEEAKAAEAEAKRKAEKMELLRKRAEEAMAKRKMKKKENE